MANKAKQVRCYCTVMLELEVASAKTHQIQLCIQVYSFSLLCLIYSKIYEQRLYKKCFEITQSTMIMI